MMEANNNIKIFKQNIDLYWRTIAVYGAILIIYSLLVGTWEEGVLSLKIKDPISILLIIILSVSIGTLISRYYRQKSIIFEDGSITFSYRYGSKTFQLRDIEFIKFTKEKIYKTRRKYSVVKIKFTNHKRLLRIRPSAFENSDELSSLLQNLR